MSDPRAENGRFLPGCTPGPGRPPGSRIAQLRAALLDGVTPDDLQAVVQKLVWMARDGDIAAIRELLDRVFGRPVASAVTIGSAPESADIDEKRQRLAEIAARVTVAEEIRRHDPGYVEYLREQAVREDAGPI